MRAHNVHSAFSCRLALNREYKTELKRLFGTVAFGRQSRSLLLHTVISGRNRRLRFFPKRAEKRRRFSPLVFSQTPDCFTRYSATRNGVYLFTLLRTDICVCLNFVVVVVVVDGVFVRGCIAFLTLLLALLFNFVCFIGWGVGEF